MILYLDTSALVKIYFSETGSELVRQAVPRSSQNATSVLSYVETRSAFSRKLRMKELDEQGFRRHKSEFERDWEFLTKLPYDAYLGQLAAELLERFALGPTTRFTSRAPGWCSTMSPHR